MYWHLIVNIYKIITNNAKNTKKTMELLRDGGIILLVASMVFLGGMIYVVKTYIEAWAINKALTEWEKNNPKTVQMYDEVGERALAVEYQEIAA